MRGNLEDICHLFRSVIAGVLMYYPDLLQKVQAISLSNNFQFAQSVTYLINITVLLIVYKIRKCWNLLIAG